MFGRQPRIPVDEEFSVTFPKTTRNTMKQYVQKLQQRLQWAYEIAKEQIEKEVNRRKLYYDRKVHCMDVIPGDLVLGQTKSIRDSAQNRRQVGVASLQSCRTVWGEPTIQKFQKIGGVGGDDLRVLHRNMLYPFIGVREMDGDNSEEEVRCLPEKSLLDPRAAALQRADYFMGNLFR